LLLTFGRVKADEKERNVENDDYSTWRGSLGAMQSAIQDIFALDRFPEELRLTMQKMRELLIVYCDLWKT